MKIHGNQWICNHTWCMTSVKLSSYYFTVVPLLLVLRWRHLSTFLHMWYVQRPKMDIRSKEIFWFGKTNISANAHFEIMKMSWESMGLKWVTHDQNYMECKFDEWWNEQTLIPKSKLYTRIARVI